MPRTSSKESHQEQEARVISASVECILESSLLDFTMAAVAKKAKLSLGSVYKHIKSKEDVLVAVATGMLRHQRSVFEDIFELPLTMPERLMCLSLLSPEARNLYPFGFHLETLTSNAAVLQRASDRWVRDLRQIDEAIFNLCMGNIRRSSQEGELQVEPENALQMVDSLAMGVWSMNVGFIQVAYQREARNPESEAVALPFPLPYGHSFVGSMQAFLNTFPWRTLLDEAGIAKAGDALQEKGFR